MLTALCEGCIPSNSGVQHLEDPLQLVAFFWIWQYHSVLPRNSAWRIRFYASAPQALVIQTVLKGRGLEMEETVSNNSTSAPAQINLIYCGIEIKRKLTFMLLQWKKQHMQLHFLFSHNAVQRVDHKVTLENEFIASYHCSKDTLLK